MNNKFLLFFMFIFIISISAVNAHDNIANDVCGNQTGSFTLETDDVGNFKDLNDEISKISTGGNLTLKKNYKYASNDSQYKNGIEIAVDNIVIDGNGYGIDGAGQARIFEITSNNVTLKNIKFLNGYSTENGGAIYTIGNLNILDSMFNNNTANKSGGAVFVESAFSNSKINSTFINNRANNGGAIYFNDAIVNVTIRGYFKTNSAERVGGAIFAKGKSINNTFASEFYNNAANLASGGAIFFYNLAENNRFESVFRYNFALYGGGIMFYSKANNNKFDCDFRFNVAKSCGGAIFFYNTTNKNNFSGYFINNSALGEVSQINGNGGAITFKDSSSNSIFTCDFVNNFAARTGGGVNYRQTPYNITFNSNFINNSAETGGGVNFFESLENVVFNGQFIGNNASYGGAIALKNGDIKNTSFRNNRAETGGAIYFDNNGTVVNCEFNDNAISDDYGNGGAIYFRNSGIITDCNFTNNKAIYYAGAVYFGSDAIIHNSNFNGNDAQNGGSVYILGSGEVNNCNFTNNTARTGGAIEFWGNGTVNNSNFNDNVASFSGGAIYSSKNLVINDCTFNNNSAEGYAGGAVNIFAKGEINHCVFNGNRASFKGGAIFFNGDGIVMNTTITNTNTEEGSIYFRKNGIINESDFINNTAKDGGAILSYGNLTIDNSRLENNLATLGTNHISLKNDATIKLINMDPKDFEPFYIGYLNIINSVDVTYGENVIISVNVSDQNHIPFNNGTISVIIDNDVYTANVENGSANVTIPKPNAGNYDVNVTYTGNEYVAISQVKFNVSKQNAVISAASKSYVINYGGKYSIVLKSVKGNVIASKKVTFKLNGKNLGSIVTNSKGVATISLTSKILKTAKAGKKNLVIQFTDSNYNSASKTVKITINKEKTKLIAKNKGFKKSNKIKKYAISLKNSKGKVIKKASVALKVKGKIYKAKTNSKGKAIFKITKLNKKGKFSAVIKFSANKYYAAASKKVKITIK